MSDKETIKIWRNIIGEHDCKKIELDYDFRELEQYLDIFYGIPYEYKEEVLEKFYVLLVFYIMDNEPSNIPKHNKAITKQPTL